MIKQIIDISWPINEKTTEYKNRNSIIIDQIKDMKTHGICEHMIHFHNHTGTHIDTQAHCIENGITTSQIQLERLLNVSAILLDFTYVENCITKSDLIKEDAKIIANTSLLLKTKNSLLHHDAPFFTNFIYLASDAANYLVEKKISVIGIDYLGIERNQPGHSTHKTLLNNNIYILEGLRLAHVNPGEYMMACLPISIPAIDAVPTRAVLLK